METIATVHGKKVSGAESAWYCLRAKPKHEHIAAAHLRILPGVTVFCPRIRFQRATQRGLVWVTEAMFPGYLFARFELAEMHRQVCYAHGVSGIVRFADRYPTIDEEQLQTQAGIAEIKELNYRLAEGDHETIVEGALAGLEAGGFQGIAGQERVKVLMDFLGRKTEAEVERSIVLREVEHPLAA